MRRGFLVTDEGEENEDFTTRYAAMGDRDPASIEEPEGDEEEDETDTDAPSKDDETDDEEEDVDETDTDTQPEGVKSLTE